MSKGMLIFAWVAAILVSGLILKFFPAPFVWICLCWCCVFLLVVVLARKTVWKFLALNLGVIFLMLCLVEAFLWVKSKSAVDRNSHYEGSYTNNYFREDNYLGYAPPTNVAVTSSKFFNGKLLYSTVYTIAGNGLRVSPPCRGTNESGSVLFFGCSFTFGEGVHDDETMPFQVGVLTGGKYCIYNFGFHGYGPHQMLSAIEHGKVDSVVRSRPRYAIYQALTDHAWRAAGKAPYGQHGPKYTLEKDGTITYRGHFDDVKPRKRSALNKAISRNVEKSFLITYLRKPMLEPTNADIELAAAIVDQSRRILEAKYPGIEFHVLLWQGGRRKTSKTIDELSKRNIRIHLIPDVLKDYRGEREKFLTIEHEGHPTPAGQRAIAEYVVQSILKGTSENYFSEPGL